MMFCKNNVIVKEFYFENFGVRYNMRWVSDNLGSGCIFPRWCQMCLILGFRCLT